MTLSYTQKQLQYSDLFCNIFLVVIW